MLGEDGSCHEATSSVSATATIRAARACWSLGSRQLQCCDGSLVHLFPGSITAPSGPRRGFSKTDTGSCQAPCRGRDEGLGRAALLAAGEGAREDGRCMDGVPSLRAIELSTAEQLNHPRLFSSHLLKVHDVDARDGFTQDGRRQAGIPQIGTASWVAVWAFDVFWFFFDVMHP